MTGIDSPYEPPNNPEIRINTADRTAEEAAEEIFVYLETNGFLSIWEGPGSGI